MQPRATHQLNNTVYSSLRYLPQLEARDVGGSSSAKIREAQIGNGFKSTEVKGKKETFVNLCKNIANKFDVSEAKQEAAASEFKNNFKEPEK